MVVQLVNKISSECSGLIFLGKIYNLKENKFYIYIKITYNNPKIEYVI